MTTSNLFCTACGLRLTHRTNDTTSACFWGHPVDQAVRPAAPADCCRQAALPACPDCGYLAPRSTRKCAAWIDCGNLAVPVADLSFRGFCPACEATALGQTLTFAQLDPLAQAAVEVFQAEREADADWSAWARFDVGHISVTALLARLTANDTRWLVAAEAGRGPSAAAALWPVILGTDDIVVLEDGYHRLAAYIERGLTSVPFVRFA